MDVLFMLTNIRPEYIFVKCRDAAVVAESTRDPHKQTRTQRRPGGKLKASYSEFLDSKRITVGSVGRDIESAEISTVLYDFQRDVVKWAMRRGRAAIFQDCGLGKTLQQLEWARLVGGTVLIVAPLSVSEQTIAEALKIDLDVRYVTDTSEMAPGIQITNYERLHRLMDAPPVLDGIVLDESSILKSIDGKTRALLLEHFTSIPWRLCCTATPCPNDIAELANHSEFLGVMKRTDMLSSFFVHDQDGWRMRGHAREPFFRWMASWAMAMKSPSDLGYDGSRFNLPPLNISDEVVATEWRRPGELFPGKLKGITDRSAVRRSSIEDRVARAAEIANTVDDQVIVWCGLKDESTAATAAIPDAVEVCGADSVEKKIGAIRGFLAGEHRVLVTKPKIAGFGMNFQNASRMIFLGLSDSYESYYQCIRREWRYGQTRPVNVHVVVTDHETEIVNNVRRKEIQAEQLSAEIVAAARKYEMEELGMVKSETETIVNDEFEGENWKLYQGDCVEEMVKIEDESVDLSVFSPPFLALYQYSDTERDLGNSSGGEEFFEHFRYVIDELMRITKPGRNCCVHASQVATTLSTHGVIGLRDFRGEVIAEFIDRGWIYHGEVCIDKCPQAQAIRTHAKGLLFTQMHKDSSWSRPGLADYVLIFRKPGDNAVPIHPDITNDQWIEWARPIWYNIRESDTLNTTEAKSNEDDRHICPLQLGTIERCVRLWSNEGETVFSPFAGIGSELYQAVMLGRYGLGIELKPLYARTAAKNCRSAEQKMNQPTLFSEAAK